MNLGLAYKIMRGVWAIDPRYLDANWFMVEDYLSGKLNYEVDEKEKAEKFSLKVFNSTKSAVTNVSSFKEAPPDSVAVIKVFGPLEKADFCGDPGTSTMRRWLNEAMQEPNISGAVLWLDTPGGTVDGTEGFASDISNASKPVVAFVDGMACSAGVWIASSADYIILEGKSTEMGSIGVAFSFADRTQNYENNGIKLHYVTADQSSDKNLDFLEAKKGNYELIKKEGLNPLADLFITHVKQNRADAIKDKAPIFSGKVFLGAEAIKHGLADGFGSMQDAVNKVIELAKMGNNDPSSAGANNNKFNIMTKFNRVSTLLAIDALEKTDEGIYLNEEQLQSIEATLEKNDSTSSALKKAADDAAAALKAALDDAKKAADAAKEAADKAAATIKELQDQVDALKNAKGADHAKVKSESDNSDGNELTALNAVCEGDTIDAIRALREAGY